MTHLLDEIKKHRIMVLPFFKNGKIVWCAEAIPSNEVPAVSMRSSRDLGYVIDPDGFEFHDSPEAAVQSVLNNIAKG